VGQIASRESTEQTLLDLLARQDEAAIRLIYEQYAGILFNTILRIVRDENSAQDVFQESMLRIWRKHGTYDPARGSFFTWMLSVCKHAAIDMTRTGAYKRRNQPELEEKHMSKAENRSAPEGENSHLREMINLLPEKQKTLIDMAYFHGYTHEEISISLSIPLGTVKTRIRSALIYLRSLL
jgi:RNA polymerase sigma factor (sigma-70 family)